MTVLVTSSQDERRSVHLIVVHNILHQLGFDEINTSSMRAWRYILKGFLGPTSGLKLGRARDSGSRLLTELALSLVARSTLGRSTLAHDTKGNCVPSMRCPSLTIPSWNLQKRQEPSNRCPYQMYELISRNS